MRGTAREFRPFATRTRKTIIAIVLTAALVSTASTLISIRSTSKSKNRAAVVEIAGRQRALAERYVTQVILAKQGIDVRPARTAAPTRTR